MRTAWHCGNVAPMCADAALARVRDVSPRSASHRCSARRNAPSRSPTLPTRRDLRATANGFARVLVAAAGGGIALTGNGVRCARSRRGLICTTGLRFEYLSASTADRGAAAGGPIGKLAQCTVRSRLGPRQQAHCSSRAKGWSPGYQPLLVPPGNWSKRPVPSQLASVRRGAVNSRASDAPMP
jgi:hypothetical protein